MSKIKVLQIIGNACLGGVETYIFNYYEQMNDNFEFIFLCYDDSKFLPNDVVAHFGGKVLTIPNIKHLFKFNKCLRRILKENEFDIVHSHLNTLSVFPLRIAKKCGYKIRIAESHSTSSPHEIIRNFVKSILKMFSTKYATHLLASGYEAGIYQFGVKNSNNFEVVNCTINSARFKFNEKIRNDLRNKYNFNKDDYIVGHVGRYCTTKNQKFLLKVAKNIPDYRFVFIGSGDYHKLKLICNRKNIKNVTFISAQKNIENFYNMFDVFALPSLYEAFGIVTLEALCNGLYCFISKFAPKSSLVNGYGEQLDLKKEIWIKSLREKKIRNNDLNSFSKYGFESEGNMNLANVYYKCLNK